MPQFRNMTDQSFAFVVGQKDGEPVVEDLRPGETRSFEVGDDNKAMQAHLAVGSIVQVKGRQAAAAAPHGAKAKE